jgi:phage terminase small subunit
MAALTNPKHEHFAQLVAAGETPAKSYALVGYSEKGAAQSANRLLKDAKVSTRVSGLREAVAERAVEKAALDRAWVLAQLRENVERAMQAKAPTDENGRPCGEYRYEGQVANRALELIGKELGMFKDQQRVEMEGGLSLVDVIRARRKRRGEEEDGPAVSSASPQSS